MSKPKKQVAALPWRRQNDEIQVLLVTTRTTRRWVIPKGWRMDGRNDAEAAAQEAFEEAGVHGRIAEEPLGKFRYDKLLQSGDARNLKVAVYALEVTEELEDWPERGQRERHWFSLKDAMTAVSEAELAGLIATFSPPTVSAEPVAAGPSLWARIADLLAGR